MLFGVILALVCGTALARPHIGEQPRTYDVRPQNHHMNPNPFGASSLTEGFLCDACVIGVEDLQGVIDANKAGIINLLGRVSSLCSICPVEDACIDFFTTEVPAVIDEFLAESPNDLCTLAGVCNPNATLPGLVMTGLNEHVARDRVIRRMLKRARMMQQNMIRMILGDEYMCDACHDFISIARDVLLDNDTQHEVMNFMAPLCDYMPAEYQADCDEFVESIPSLMSMLANDILLDSTCDEIGLCNSTSATKSPVVDTLPDILSRLGFPEIGAGIGRGQNPFNFPRGDRLNPGFQIPEQPVRNPFGNPRGERPQTGPFGAPVQRPERPYGHPREETPHGKWPSNSRPEIRPQRPYKPKPRPKATPAPETGINWENIFGKNPGGVFDRMPEIPDIRVPGLGNINFGFGNSQRGGRRQRSAKYSLENVGQLLGVDFDKIMPEQFIPKDKVFEYVPEPIPDAGITLTPEQIQPAYGIEQCGFGYGHQDAPDVCETCKVMVGAVDTWLNDNAVELQRMVLKLVRPFCQVFPSPMKEDCSSDVAEYTQNFINALISRLQPDKICTRIGVCGTDADVLPDAPLLPTEGVEPAGPTTWPMMP